MDQETKICIEEAAELEECRSAESDEVAVSEEFTPAGECDIKATLNTRQTGKLYRVYFLNNISGPRPEQYGAEPLVYNPNTRNGFIRTTMGILLVQLLFTSLCLIIVNSNEKIRMLLRPFFFNLVIICIIIMFVVLFGMVCCACGRRLPCNIVLLSVGTASQTMLAATMTVHLKTMSLTIAAVTTLCVVAMCFGLAFTKFDFTRYYIVVAGVLLALVVGSFLITIFNSMYPGQLTWVSMGVSLLITLAVAVTLIIELQMVLGGRSLQYGTDDYAYAAYTLYSSIIIIFLRLAIIVESLSK